MDAALHWLAQHAQAPLGDAKTGQEVFDLSYLIVPQALECVARYLDLPEESFPRMQVDKWWRSSPFAIAGTLYDAVALARSLAPQERESYLDFLHFSFTLKGVRASLGSLERHYKIETMPDFAEALRTRPNDGNPEAEDEHRGTSVSESAMLQFLGSGDDRTVPMWSNARANSILVQIALHRCPHLDDYMAEICEAALQDNLSFFKCLPKAIEWKPNEEKLTADKLAALPQGTQKTARTLARRYWVSRGLWMLSSERLGRLCPALKGNTELTTPSNDNLYREARYTKAIQGVLSSEDGPRIQGSILAWTC